MSLVDAAGSGDRRRTLEALRAVLAASIVDVDPDKRAPLVNQMRRVLAELDELPAGREESASDDLADRRAARRAGAEGSAPAAGGGV